jgi:hypothetical protein
MYRIWLPFFDLSETEPLCTHLSGLMGSEVIIAHPDHGKKNDLEQVFWALPSTSDIRSRVGAVGNSAFRSILRLEEMLARATNAVP